MVAPIYGRGHCHVYRRTDMKPHPLGPRALARELAKIPNVSDGLSEEDLLDDIRGFPGIYYCDHVSMSRYRGVLPLSEPSWRMACLSS